MPTSFQTQRKSARNLVLAANKQAAPAGVFADVALVRRQEFDGTAAPEIMPTRRDNKQMAGKGTQFGTASQITGWDSKLAFKADADDWLVGWALALLFGADTVTGAGVPYNHAFTFDFSTDDAPLTNVYIEDTAGVKYRMQDMAVADVSLTIPSRGVLSLDITMIGTGRWSDGAMVALPAAPATFRYLLGSDCTYSLGPVGALAAFDGRHITTTFKIATGAINHVASGAGLFGIKVRRGDLAFSVDTTIAAKETDDIRTLLNNDTPAEMRWDVNSGAQAHLLIDLPNVRLKMAKIGMDGEMVVYQISADQTTILSVAGASAITATLVNSVPTYLTAI